MLEERLLRNQARINPMSNSNQLGGADYRVRRMKERASYDKAHIHELLDRCLVGHVGFVHDGFPVVIPMVVWRVGEYLHLHSANKGRLASVCDGANLCVSMAHLDGLVLARSAFHHSLNYRSLVVHGVAEAVGEAPLKLEALKALVELIRPGRFDALRPITESELSATVVLRISLERASVKSRAGMPRDDAEDVSWPVWAGVVPVATELGEAERDPQTPAGVTAGAPLNSRKRL